MKLYTVNDLIDLVQSLKDYTHESHNILGHDEREAKEFVDIFLENRTSIELPSDEELDEWIVKNDYQFSCFDIQTTKWVIEQIKKQDNG